VSGFAVGKISYLVPLNKTHIEREQKRVSRSNGGFGEKSVVIMEKSS